MQKLYIPNNCFAIGYLTFLILRLFVSYDWQATTTTLHPNTQHVLVRTPHWLSIHHTLQAAMSLLATNCVHDCARLEVQLRFSCLVQQRTFLHVHVYSFWMSVDSVFGGEQQRLYPGMGSNWKSFYIPPPLQKTTETRGEKFLQNFISGRDGPVKSAQTRQ